jgi:hypothetical protein
MAFRAISVCASVPFLMSYRKTVTSHSSFFDRPEYRRHGVLPAKEVRSSPSSYGRFAPETSLDAADTIEEKYDIRPALWWLAERRHGGQAASPPRENQTGAKAWNILY